MTNPGGGKTYPSGDHLISVADAAAMTARFRSQNAAATRAWYFHRSALDALLSQAGCGGLRIYRAQAENGDLQLVLVGTDAQGNDLLPKTVKESGLVAERAWPCPPMCAAASVL